jgi:hypothetical protein
MATGMGEGIEDPPPPPLLFFRRREEGRKESRPYSGYPSSLRKFEESSSMDGCH